MCWFGNNYFYIHFWFLIASIQSLLYTKRWNAIHVCEWIKVLCAWKIFILYARIFLIFSHINITFNNEQKYLIYCKNSIQNQNCNKKNSKRKCYSGYCLATACNISGNTLSLLLFLLHKNSSMYEARKVCRHPCILLSFPLNRPHIFSIVFVWIPWGSTKCRRWFTVLCVYSNAKNKTNFFYSSCLHKLTRAILIKQVRK